MNWEIKKIESKSDFDKLEKFYREKMPKFYHIKLSSNYLYWKLKQNKKFNGVMLIAINNHEIIGSLSLTFKSIIFEDKKNYVAEIGDSYVDFSAQKFLTKKKNLISEYNFENRSIFGSLVHYILKIAKEKKIEFIYGVPNNTSMQGYVKKLNFKIVKKLNLYGYILPNFKTSYKTTNFLNYILNFYRFLLRKIIYRRLSFIVEKNISSDEIKTLFKAKKNHYYLDKDEEYFKEKYKLNPENNYKFCKIYIKKNLIGAFVIKEDFTARKVYIVDCLCKTEVKYLTIYAVLAVNSKYNFSVNFWEKDTNINFLDRIIHIIFKRKKINIIYFNDISLDQYTFFNEFYLGHSDNF